MTYEEYLKLYDEWKSTDSIKRKDEIEDIIHETAYDLLQKLNKVYANWGRKFVQESDYRDDRGYCELNTEELEYDGNSHVWLKYTDSWAYGGYCEFEIAVPMKYLDEKNIQELEDQLLEDRIELLRKKIDESNAGIRILEESKLKYCEELNEKNKMMEKRVKAKEQEHKVADERAWEERWRKQREEAAKKREEQKNG